ncbi:hypothetical protein WJX73_006587 [Symbiochloris irregularis]|uniref:Phytanoyl-CoA dioxygenase n=1 Tax=Symbiochloris irregularis TaxID=706552 RepID=A0AAW1PDK9_9CHLO
MVSTRGYTVVTDWLDARELEVLRTEAEILYEERLARYFTCSSPDAALVHNRGCVLETTSCSSLAPCLGTSGYLFNEQFVVKPPGVPAAAFPWHRDCQWLPQGGLADYISVWVALDDADSDNGGLLVAEEFHATSQSEEQPHKGRALSVKAGTAVVMSSHLWHSSGPNTSRHSRRAWMPQFSCSPITAAEGPVCLAVPMPENDGTHRPGGHQGN